MSNLCCFYCDPLRKHSCGLPAEGLTSENLLPTSLNQMLEHRPRLLLVSFWQGKALLAGSLTTSAQWTLAWPADQAPESQESATADGSIE